MVTVLDRDYVHPVSYEKALEYAKSTKPSFTEKLIAGLVLAYVEGGEYAVSEFHKNKKEPNDPLLKLYAFYGGLKNLPSSIKIVFSTTKEDEAKELMEKHNREAAKIFNGFKNDITYFLNKS